MKDPPIWPPRHGRSRVLVEARDPERRRRLGSALETSGYEVLDCEGPDPDHDHLCPAVEGGRCPGAAHADVVVCSFDDNDPHTRGLPTAVVRELRAGAVAIVLVEESLAARYEQELEGCRLLADAVPVDDVVAAVAEALDELSRTPPPRPFRSRRLIWSQSVRR